MITIKKMLQADKPDQHGDTYSEEALKNMVLGMKKNIKNGTTSAMARQLGGTVIGVDYRNKCVYVTIDDVGSGGLTTKNIGI